MREWVANIFFYRRGGTTIMIDAGYNYERLEEKMGWLGIDPKSIKHILITHQDTDHIGAVDDVSLTYVQCGILAAILLNSGAADYVITDCGTGEGAMLACNSFPGVICGHVEDPVDAYTFAQVNDGNCVAMPFAKGCGWGMELNWEYTFEKLFGFGSGKGYPADRVVPEQNNKKILDCVREITMNDLIASLKAIDNMGPRDGITNCEHLVTKAVAAPGFKKYFFDNCKCDAMKAYIEETSK